MNDEHIDIDRIAMEAHFLHALDIENSQSERSLSDMERQDYIDMIKSLKEEREQLREMISSLQDTIKSLNQQMARHDEIDAAKDKRIAELNEKIDKLTIALTSTTERLNIMLDEKFNKKSKSNRHDNNKPAKKSRDQEKEEDDGTESNGGSTATSSVNDESLDKAKVFSENLDGKRGPRGKYTTMDAARVVEHKTTKMPIVPPGWVFVAYKFVDEYTKYSYIQCDRFQVAIYEDEFGRRHEFFNPASPNDDKRPRENAIPGTHCTAELMAEIILDNIKLGLPLHRCNDKMVYDGFHVSENTRKNWMYKTLELLKPLKLHLKKELFEVTKILNIDETWCRVRIKCQGDNTKLGSLCKKYIWVIVNKITKVTYFLYDNDENDSRGTRPLQEFLGEFAGAIQSDGYIVYTKLAKRHPELIKHLECWAHVRARFKNAFDVSKDAIAGWLLNRLGGCILLKQNAS